MAIAKFTLVEVVAGGDKPTVQPWTPAAYEQPGLDTAHKLLGVTMSASDYEEPVACMKRGYLRGCPEQNGETWAVGDILWAEEDGSITNTRPEAPLPLVVVGVVFADEGSGGPFTVAVDVRVLPSLGELSGVKVETPEDLDVLIYDSATNVWEPRALVLDDMSDVDVPAPGDGQVLAYDASSGQWVAVDPVTNLDDLADVDVPAPGDGQVLTYDASSGQWVAADPGAGGTLDGLADVSVPAPGDGQVLAYDASSGQWVAAEVAPGAAALDDLTDVNTPAPGDGQVLAWDASSGQWVAADQPPVVAALDDLTDVNAPAPGDGQVLAWDASSGQWIAADQEAASVPAHAASHEDGGDDELEVADLAAAETNTSKRLAPDGAGGVTWVDWGAGAGTVYHQARFAMFSPAPGGSVHPLLEAGSTVNVTRVRCIHKGSGSVSVNVTKNYRGGAPSDILASDLVSSATAWSNAAASGGGVSLSDGDELDVELVGVAGYVEHVVVVVDYEETL